MDCSNRVFWLERVPRFVLCTYRLLTTSSIFVLRHVAHIFVLKSQITLEHKQETHAKAHTDVSLCVSLCTHERVANFVGGKKGDTQPGFSHYPGTS